MEPHSTVVCSLIRNNLLITHSLESPYTTLLFTDGSICNLYRENHFVQTKKLTKGGHVSYGWINTQHTRIQKNTYCQFFVLLIDDNNATTGFFCKFSSSCQSLQIKVPYCTYHSNLMDCLLIINQSIYSILPTFQCPWFWLDFE